MAKSIPVEISVSKGDIVLNQNTQNFDGKTYYGATITRADVSLVTEGSGRTTAQALGFNISLDKKTYDRLQRYVEIDNDVCDRRKFKLSGNLELGLE